MLFLASGIVTRPFVSSTALTSPEELSRISSQELRSTVKPINLFDDLHDILSDMRLVRRSTWFRISGMLQSFGLFWS